MYKTSVWHIASANDTNNFQREENKIDFKAVQYPEIT